MDKELLLSLQKRNKERLIQLREQLEKGEARAEDLQAIQDEINQINQQLQQIADALAQLDSGSDSDGNPNDQQSRDGEPGDGEEGDEGDESGESEQRSAGISDEQRNGIMKAIAAGLSTRGKVSVKPNEQEIRRAFARFVVGQISETEARSLGVEAGNGSVVIPESIANEIITYTEEQNLLRKYGSIHRTKGYMKWPVLVKKAEANVNKKERTTEIPETDIEFDEVLLDPAEFDALATVTKKLLYMTGMPIEDIVLNELKKAYAEKETNYMFNGNDPGNENPGALAKKAVAYIESTPVDLNADGWSQKLYSQLVKLKGQPKTAVLKKSMWIVNRAALTILEDMTDTTGRPLLHEAVDGVGYKLLGHNLDFTDAADGSDPSVPVFYFGDFSSFHIQDVIGAMELQRLVEKFSGTNKVGFQIYNLLDGQLIYSPLEPTVYRYEVGATAPSQG